MKTIDEVKAALRRTEKDWQRSQQALNWCGSSEIYGAAADHLDRLETKVREMEDACLFLWSELPAEQVKILDAYTPRLIEFLRHLHHSIEHEQAMVRVNVWADL